MNTVVKDLEESQAKSEELSLKVKILREELQRCSTDTVMTETAIGGDDDSVVEMKDATTQANIWNLHRQKVHSMLEEYSCYVHYRLQLNCTKKAQNKVLVLK